MKDKATVDDLHSGKAQARIIDIRKKPDDKQIPGSERYSGEALANADALPFEKDENVVLYCGSGNSCSILAQQLRERGYANAVALEGGYAAWNDAGFETEPISEQREV